MTSQHKRGHKHFTNVPVFQWLTVLSQWKPPCWVLTCAVPTAEPWRDVTSPAQGDRLFRRDLKKNKKKRHQNTYEGMKSQSFFLSWNSSQLSSQGQRNWKTNAEIQATRTLTPLLRFSLLQMSRALTALLASFLSSSIFFFQLLSVAASFAAQPVDTCWWAHRAESIGYRKISEASETSKVSTTRKRTVTECDSQHWKSYE